MLSNTGRDIPVSSHRLLATLALQAGDHVSYALEGSIFVAGAALQWLRDGLGLFSQNSEIDGLARQAHPDGAVQMIPAFVGLGAPWWDADARGALFGLTRDTGVQDLVRAALDAACHQTADLMQAMAADGAPISVLRVDGGMTASDWFVQRLADLIGVPVERPTETETTALGAAWLAGSAVGRLPPLGDLPQLWKLDRRFEPGMSEDRRASHRAAWLNAIERVKTSE
jgi:glycerol kinase